MDDSPLFIPPQVAHEIRRMADHGANPLGLEDACDTPAETELRDDAVIQDALRGLSPERAAMLHATLPYHLTNRDMPIGSVFAGLIASVGIDPLVLTWLALAVRQIVILQGMNRICTLTNDAWDDARNISSIDLGELHWFQNGEFMASGLPDTVLADCVGRRLGEIVHHPLLDPDTPIIEARTLKEMLPSIGCRTLLITSHAEDPATPDQLLALSREVHSRRPRPC